MRKTNKYDFNIFNLYFQMLSNIVYKNYLN